MKVAMSGASGFIGGAVGGLLKQRGHEVIALVRSAPKHPLQIDPWHNPKESAKVLETVDAVIHLAGRPILPPWTAKAKREIRDSRIDLTRQLSELLSGLDQVPRIALMGSATGIYGDRGDQVLDERQTPGTTGFLAEVAVAWEQAAESLNSCCRLVHLRTGIVLDPSGGMLKKLVLPTKLGLLGQLGPGNQWFSWISLNDIARAIVFAVENEGIQGPVNLVSPEPVTNRQLTKLLGKALHRPTVLRAPAWFLKLVFGDAARELFLASTRAVPQVLQRANFHFEDPTLGPALTKMFSKA